MEQRHPEKKDNLEDSDLPVQKKKKTEPAPPVQDEIDFLS